LGHDIDCLLDPTAGLGCCRRWRRVSLFSRCRRNFCFGIEILNVPNQITIRISTEMKAPAPVCILELAGKLPVFTTGRLPKR
jgi:hypothetical protein